MKNIVAWFVKNPVAANLLMMLMFVTGLFGYLNLEREFIPQTTINGMTVNISWPGASPRDVEEQLVVRVEEAIDGLDVAPSRLLQNLALIMKNWSMRFKAVSTLSKTFRQIPFGQKSGGLRLDLILCIWHFTGRLIA